MNRHLHLNILPRNEGKLKSHDSCHDLRAWSHVKESRSQYLKEWIRADMPICILPFRSILNLVGNMTITSRSSVPPKCHPDCKSKLILDNIYESCDAMKKCLTEIRSLDNFFEEEELDTSHWPCDKCLTALKTIKIVWNVLVERLLGKKICKCYTNGTSNRQNNSLQSIAMSWRKEIIQQSFYIRCRNKDQLPHRFPNNSNSWDNIYLQKPIYDSSDRNCKSEYGKPLRALNPRKYRELDKKNVIDDKETQTCNILCYIHRKNIKKINKYTSTNVNREDKCCDTCEFDIPLYDDGAYLKSKMSEIQHQLFEEKIVNEKLRRDNKSLREELHNVYTNCTWKICVDPAEEDSRYSAHLVPKCSIESNDRDRLDSETVITMQKMHDKSYKHVSLLQMLHKTNKPTLDEISLSGPCLKPQTPLHILNDVKNTFTSLLKREIIKNRKQDHAQDFDLSLSQSSDSSPSTTVVSDKNCDFLSADGLVF